MSKLLLASFLACAALGACTKSHDDAATTAATAEASLPTATVDEVDHAVTGGQWQAVDANSDATRHQMGVVPGAILLTDSDSFKASELPADKSKGLVFYCANTHCGASHAAAAKARIAGYSQVKVMPEGIAGWVKAGKKVQNI